MTDYAVMPKADYVAACNTIRKKIGDNEVIKSGEIANKINDVYSVGQLSLVQNSEHIYPSVSGGVIAVDDVNEVEHNVRVMLTSETITDFSKIEVYRYGKNIFKKERDKTVSEAWVTNTTPIKPDGNKIYKGISYSNYRASQHIADLVIGDTVSFKVTTSSIQYGVGFDVKVMPNTTYTISIGEMVNGGIYVNYYDKDGKYLKFGKDTYTFTTTATTEWIVLVLRANEAEVMSSFGNIQIQLGNIATEYEEYVKPQVIKANTDGTVDGLTSLSPNMTLQTNTDDVMIHCEYCRDIDKYIKKIKTA